MSCWLFGRLICQRQRETRKRHLQNQMSDGPREQSRYTVGLCTVEQLALAGKIHDTRWQAHISAVKGCLVGLS